MRGGDQQQYYLRAEPSPEGRIVLRAHLSGLTTVFRDLRIHPHGTAIQDIHWTALFLDSPRRWAKCFHALGLHAIPTHDDLAALATGQTRSVEMTAAYPHSYDVFYTGPTSAAFVLRLAGTERITKGLLDAVRITLKRWERDGRIAPGAVERIFGSSLFPLAREIRDKQPHVTLARGRVSRDRRRDVVRSVRATALASRSPISFSAPTLRVVGVRPPVADA